jgi:hypothetical protein
MAGSRPLLSVIIEGYNESLALGSARRSIDALLGQDFPLDRVEVLLVGAHSEAGCWAGLDQSLRHRFHDVRIAVRDDLHYYALKNCGADLAQGEILVFLDSDTLPAAGWLQSIAAGFADGAQAQAGVTSFTSGKDGRGEGPVLQAAASISWGFLVPPQGVVTARGFLSHNLAVRAELFRAIRYREDLGRTCAGHFLGQAFAERGIEIVFNPAQRVQHLFSFGWWLRRLHVRFGHEVYLLRRLDPRMHHHWVTKLGWLEPLAVGAWHVCIDLPQWRRYANARRISRAHWLACAPLVLLLSLLARGAEVAGMYATMANPRRMRRFACSN